MIPYLDVQHLSKSFGALQLFQDISFSIGEGQRVGLIAKNGTGKSTLLSILSGKEGYDSGDIVFRRDLKVGFLEQSPVFDPNESVLSQAGADAVEDTKSPTAYGGTEWWPAETRGFGQCVANGTRPADT